MLNTKPILKGLSVIWGLFLLVELAYAVGLRPWVMRWGATDSEVTAALPGDPFIKPNSVISTRAIIIQAPVTKVWPWVAQLGQERGGFYSYTFLENLFGAQMVNADHVLPPDQWAKIGDRFSYMANGPEGTYGKVDLLQPQRALNAHGWCFVLEAVDDHTTRLLVRYSYQPGDTLMGKVVYYGMFEQIHFVMESGMMMGIKQRAETSSSGL